MKFNKNYTILILSLLIVVFFALTIKANIFKNRASKNQVSGKIKIITTLYPLYDFANQIGRDNIENILLLPAGIEAHSFEPKPYDIVKINTADIFIYTGKFMELWAQKILQGVDNKKLIIIDASYNIKLVKTVFLDEDEQTGGYDPHIWLDFDNVKIITKNIADALSQKDPLNSNYYQENLQEFQNQLTDLDNEYKQSLKNCKQKEIIYAGHYAFGYLAKRYNLKYIAAEGVSADTEPTVSDILKLINQIKQNNIKYIFYEELASPRLPQSLVKETKAKLLLLNAAHNLSKDQISQKISFITIMKNNLDNLIIGLDCQKYE